MSVRVPWDIYEAALILDMYFHIEQGEIKNATGLQNFQSFSG